MAKKCPPKRRPQSPRRKPRTRRRRSRPRSFRSGVRSRQAAQRLRCRRRQLKKNLANAIKAAMDAAGGGPFDYKGRIFGLGKKGERYF